MTKKEIRERLKALVRRIHHAAPAEAAPDDLPLLDEDAVFDSVTALQLVLSIEEEFQITVDDEEIKPENLRNVDSLVRFIERKFSRL